MSPKSKFTVIHKWSKIFFKVEKPHFTLISEVSVSRLRVKILTYFLFIFLLYQYMSLLEFLQIFPIVGNNFFGKWTYNFAQAENTDFGIKIFKIKILPKILRHLVSYSVNDVYLNFQKILINTNEKIPKKGGGRIILRRSV